MKLGKRNVVAIITLIAASLIGLMVIQTYLLGNAIDQERQAFRQNVNAALSHISHTVETRETVSEVFSLAVNVDEEETGEPKLMKVATFDSLWTDDKHKKFGIAMVAKPSFAIEDKKVLFSLPAEHHVEIILLDSLGNVVDSVLDEQRPAGKHEVGLNEGLMSGGKFRIRFMTDSTTYVSEMGRDYTRGVLKLPETWTERRKLVNRVVAELSSRQRRPMEERIDLAQLDSLITATLLDREIETDFASAILAPSQGDSILMTNHPEWHEEFSKSEFKAALFPSDIFTAREVLALYFPKQDLYLFKRVALLGLVSVIFIMALAFSLIYILRMLFKQKHFANRLTNFINNMTHEFKTPISTIALASESLGNPAIRDNEQKFERYRGIIKDENLRMRRQVEKILQMAVLEEMEFEFQFCEIDAHEVLTTAVENIMPQVEERRGKIETQFEASPAKLDADAVHFANIINTLLDNALKYSDHEPDIQVATETLNGGLCIRVRDHGIGIAESEQRHVFAKYYRVPTGNLHDVKGFGLGLSYVKLIVEAHGGRVDLKSEPGKGSTFEIQLPYERNDEKAKMKKLK